MRAQRNLLERAEQGDLNAIAALVATALNQPEITVRANLEHERLNIQLKGGAVLDQAKTTLLIQSSLASLKLAAIQAVHINMTWGAEENSSWESSLEVTQPVGDRQTDIQAASTPALQPSLPQPDQQDSLPSARLQMGSTIAIVSLIALNLVLGFRAMVKPWQEARSYADESIPAIVGTWNANALVDRASSELLQTTSQSSIEQQFEQFSQQLGELKQYQGATCQVNSQRSPLSDLATSHCQAAAVFEQATGTVEVELIQQDEQWQIQHFFVNLNPLPMP